jgi:hypothetical protein
MTKAELAQRLKNEIENREEIYDMPNDLFSSGYVLACKDILKLIEKLEEE